MLTRWGTWIEVALFYASHFDVVKTILAELDPREAAAIEKGQSLMESDELQRDLAFISSNLAFLPSYLKHLKSLDCLWRSHFACLMVHGSILKRLPEKEETC